MKTIGLSNKTPKLLVIVFLLCPISATEDRNTYQIVEAGKKCFQNRGGDLECEYRVGHSLYFGVVGVGKPDASIYFYSASFEGDYFAVFGLSHGCVVVRPGLKAGATKRGDLAFVSPRDGKVYRTWETCAEKN